MINLNLTASELKAYKHALRNSRSVKLDVHIRNRDEEVVSSLSAPQSWVLGGQVDIDTSSTPTRQLDLEILDPKRKLVLQADAPSELSIFASTFVSVERLDWVDTLGGYVSCPVFWGPVTRFSRDHPVVRIEALGKEALALAPYLLLTGHVFPRGSQVTTNIKRVLGSVGETRYGMRGISKKLKKKMTAPRLSEPWIIARRLADVADAYIYYDGRGRVRLVDRGKRSTWTFATGSTGTLLSVPDAAYDFTSFRNYVDVTGGIPNNTKQRVRSVSTLTNAHPLSPGALKRNGVPRYAVEVVQDDQVIRTKDAREIGEARLKRLAELGIDINFEALPVPFLEELDWVTVKGDIGNNHEIQMKRWTIPLSNDSMPVGRNRVLRWKTKIKHRRGRQPWRKGH